MKAKTKKPLPWNHPRMLSEFAWYYVNPSGSVDLVLKRDADIVSRRLTFKQVAQILSEAQWRRGR